MNYELMNALRRLDEATRVQDEYGTTSAMRELLHAMGDYTRPVGYFVRDRLLFALARIVLSDRQEGQG